MILSTRFAVLTLAVLQVSGLFVPRQDGAADVVGIISCEPADSVAHPLYLKSTPLAQSPVLPPGGIPVALSSNVLSESTTPGDFVFQQCNSTLLGLSSAPGDIVRYG
jgi:hypothetical protein